MSPFKSKLLFWLSASIIALAMAPAFSEPADNAPAKKPPAKDRPKSTSPTASKKPSSDPPRAAVLTVIKK